MLSAFTTRLERRLEREVSVSSLRVSTIDFELIVLAALMADPLLMSALLT